MARDKAREANTLRAQGINLQDLRGEQQEQVQLAKINTFELMSRAWLKSAIPNNSANSCATSVATTATSSPLPHYAWHRWSSSVLGSCVWPIGKVSISRKSYGSARLRI
ncbi:hypothetical protein [Pollutimonas nitritireducens]|nr:hypothetical protein [Pollutimonas nitritireducens]